MVSITGTFSNEGMRGASGNADDVVLVGGNVAGATTANLIVRGIYCHPIIPNADTQSPLAHDVTSAQSVSEHSRAAGPAGRADDSYLERFVRYRLSRASLRLLAAGDCLRPAGGAE